MLPDHLNVIVDHELAEESFEELRWLKYDINFDENGADSHLVESDILNKMERKRMMKYWEFFHHDFNHHFDHKLNRF